MEGIGAIERLPADAIDDAAAAIRRNGVVVIEAVWPIDTIDSLREVVFAQHPELSDPALLHDYLGTKNVRYIAPVTLSPAVVSEGLFDTSAIKALCGALLGMDYVYEAFGIIMVYPGVKPQPAHRDGGELFPETGVDRILPPCALHIAIPLVDVDPDCAPTGVAPGTHREVVQPEEAALTPVELRRGDIAVWDFRLVHGGLANRTSRIRPALYIAACRPFWIDHTNYQGAGRVKLAVDSDLLAGLGPRFVRARASG